MKSQNFTAAVRTLSLIILGCTLLSHEALFARTAIASDAPSDSGWLKQQLLSDEAHPPFSFVYGRQSSNSLFANWRKETETKRLDAARTEYSRRWTDPKTGLQFRVEVIEFSESHVVEWTAYFKNNGNLDTPVLEDVEPLDISYPLDADRIPEILYSKGCGGMDSYSLQRQPLNELESIRLSNPTGGKTGDTIPFFDVVSNSRGLIGAVGWPGDWSIDFSRPTPSAINISAGMESTHLVLHPGEEIRTPEILLLAWQGDDLDAHNELRRHILKYHTPQYDGSPVVLPVSHLGWGGMKTSTSLQLIDEISQKDLGFENFWMDAGWYGADRPVDEFQIFGKEDWFLHAGNWRINRVPHPDGLKPISDAAHAKHMKFLLWFEPERAVVGTPLTTEHPDWFIGEVTTNFEGNAARPLVKFRMFDFGNPKARQFMVGAISDIIATQGVDIYRQDCNFALTPFWTAADSADRKGITQIRYVEGLLQFWDDLRRRFPNLMLDVVQRGDLETISRAVDLSRADYPVSPDADPIGAQISTEGLSYWRPHFGTLLQIRPRDTYHIRSGFAPGLAFALFNVAGTSEEVGTFIPKDFPFEWLRTMIADLKRIRPYYYGDYYPLLPCRANSDCKGNPRDERSGSFEWAAWEFNRSQEEDGVLQAFRRDKNEEAAKWIPLKGLNASFFYNVSIGNSKKARIRGMELMEKGVRVEIKNRPGSEIIFYKAIH